VGFSGDEVDAYRRHDAVSLAGLIAKREISAAEVLEATIARAEQVDPAINAIVHKQYERAREAVAAGLPEGSLKGVPYLIRDLGFFETGEPATSGSRLFKGLLPITKRPMSRVARRGGDANCGFEPGI
jgi:Asp-tRNA(Asn)/Glu-tRNA(Gln) amidotransferase A subunit family amidase